MTKLLLFLLVGLASTVLVLLAVVLAYRLYRRLVRRVIPHPILGDLVKIGSEGTVTLVIGRKKVEVRFPLPGKCIDESLVPVLMGLAEGMGKGSAEIGRLAIEEWARSPRPMTRTRTKRSTTG